MSVVRCSAALARVASALVTALVISGCSLATAGLGVDPASGDDAAAPGDDVALPIDAPSFEVAPDDDALELGEDGARSVDDAIDDVDDALARVEGSIDGGETGAPVTPDAADAADSPDPEADVGPLAPPVVARLNLDGAALDGVDFPGHWSASPFPGACGPSHYENGPVHGTKDPGLFGGEAFGNPLKCSIGGGALAHGTYRVRLVFAELWWGPGCPGGGAGAGSRVFSVALEGKTVLTDFDVFVATGGCLASKTSSAGTPVAQTFDVVVNDGTLDLVGTPTKDNANLSAIEVLGPM